MSILHLPSASERNRGAERRARLRRLGQPESSPMKRPAPKPEPPPEPVKLDDPLAKVRTATMIAVDAGTTGRSFAKLMVREVQAAVAHEFGISVDLILSDIRQGWVVIPRMAAMALCVDLCRMSRVEVGRRFPRENGNHRDHTTVINAIASTERRRLADPEFAAHLARIEAALTGPGRICRPSR